MARRTQSDRIGHIEQVRELSAEQELALAALLAGETDEVAAERAGVTRQTISRWANHDAVFVARLNEERQRLWASHVERLRALVGDAIGVLADDLHGADERGRRAAALNILRCVGLYGVDQKPSGRTSPGAIESEWATQDLLNFM